MICGFIVDRDTSRRYAHSVVVFDEELVVVISAFQTASLIEELAVHTGDVGTLLCTQSADMPQLGDERVSVPDGHFQLYVSLVVISDRVPRGHFQLCVRHCARRSTIPRLRRPDVRETPTSRHRKQKMRKPAEAFGA